MPFLRSCALDLLVALRDLRDFHKEQLFVDAIHFYRWYFTHVEEARELKPYWSQFLKEYPSCQDAEEHLQEAAFLTWFVGNDLHCQPLFRHTWEIEQSKQKKKIFPSSQSHNG
jgi:hypothetical protein